MFSSIHCFFEQSGTFKNEFINLGFSAFDYDICNDFNCTDFVIDLFNEINLAFDSHSSIFDDFGNDDLIFAFFPCVRFENQILLHFRGQSNSFKNWDDKKKILNCMRLHHELSDFYDVINKLFYICLDKNIKLIVENPFSEEHYLRRYWCIPPSFIDYDRRVRGDYFKKPTQYWFINFEPSYNFIFEPVNCNAFDCKNPITSLSKEFYSSIGAKNLKVARSLIHPDYANRFIREFILRS